MRAPAVLRYPAVVVWLALLLVLAPVVGRACDVYDIATGTLTIPQVIVGNKIYSNVVVELVVADVRSVGGNVANPAAAVFDFYDVQTGLLTMPCVAVGPTTYSNVVTAIDRVVSAPMAVNAPVAPMLWLNFPLTDAVVGQGYSTKLVNQTSPPAQYTYAIDTLANGSLPPGMTIDFNGTLSGTPFATGAADINGWQVPHTYTFGVCAIDTISRLSTAPCPQASVIVRPTSVTASVVGSGSVSTSPAGNPCGPGCGQGFASGSQVTLTATPTSGWTFIGWSGCPGAGTGDCVLSASGDEAVVATFTQTPSLTGNWVGSWSWSGPAVNGCPANDGGAMSASLTQSGTSLSGSINVAGIQLLQDSDCAVVSTSPSAGSISGSVSGSSVTYSFTVAGSSLAFSGTATLSGNTLTTVSLVRVTGGSGSFTLTKQ
jgi:hypothetical protein